MTGGMHQVVLLGHIRTAYRTAPRSLQKQIGPSEVGMECAHCLAAKLAGWEETLGGHDWLPVIGTAVHAWLERVFTAVEHRDGEDRWVTESKVTVGYLAGEPITGSCDLLDLHAKTSVDWKIVGPTTLREAKAAGPSAQYRVQAHLYAKGWNDAGVEVNHVAIFYLPRNSASLDHAVYWSEPYDPDIANAALDRLNRLHANLTALRPLGEATVDAWIDSLPRAPGCFQCHRYPGMSPTTPPFADILAGS